MARTRTMATCHPDRRVNIKALGLCNACAEAYRYRSDPEYSDKKKAAAKEWKEKYTERRKHQNASGARMRKYGLSEEAFQSMITIQGGKCAICVNPIEVVDHDHASLKVRGLLCHPCNKGLGHFRDDVNLIRKALEYMEG